jgi:hypothetical protein
MQTTDRVRASISRCSAGPREKSPPASDHRWPLSLMSQFKCITQGSRPIASEPSRGAGRLPPRARDGDVLGPARSSRTAANAIETDRASYRGRSVGLISWTHTHPRTGGGGTRTWPPSHDRIMCVHATDPVPDRYPAGDGKFTRHWDGVALDRQGISTGGDRISDWTGGEGPILSGLICPSSQLVFLSKREMKTFTSFLHALQKGKGSKICEFKKKKTLVMMLTNKINTL